MAGDRKRSCREELVTGDFPCGELGPPDGGDPNVGAPVGGEPNGGTPDGGEPFELHRGHNLCLFHFSG